jgi:hypothetical protein
MYLILRKLVLPGVGPRLSSHCVMFPVCVCVCVCVCESRKLY